MSSNNKKLSLLDHKPKGFFHFEQSTRNFSYELCFARELIIKAEDEWRIVHRHWTESKMENLKIQ